MKQNSFVYGVAVAGYNFTGREEETNRLKRNFEGGFNSILISPRRWGKTSLVKHVCSQVDRDKVIPVFFDMFTCRNEKASLSRNKNESLYVLMNSSR